MKNKTFADLKKGDKIYAVCTDLPKLKMVELIFLNSSSTIQSKRIEFINTKDEYDAIRMTTIHKEQFNKQVISVARYVVWHTSEEDAKKTIKKTIERRIRNKKQVIKEAKRTLENYKILLKEYEQNC